MWCKNNCKRNIFCKNQDCVHVYLRYGSTLSRRNSTMVNLIPGISRPGKPPTRIILFWSSYLGMMSLRFCFVFLIHMSWENLGFCCFFFYIFIKCQKHSIRADILLSQPLNSLSIFFSFCKKKIQHASCMPFMCS